MFKIKTRKVISILNQAGIQVSQSDGKLITKALPGTLTPDYVSLIKANKEHLVEYFSEQESLVAEKIVHKIEAKEQQAESIPLSFAQQRLWFIDQFQGPSAHYNMPISLDVEGNFDVAIARQVLQHILDRHDVLRTVYVANDESATQVVKAPETVELPIIDLTEFDRKKQHVEATRLATEDACRPFDLSKDNMLRASWICLNDTPNAQKGVLLFNMHHIASDGWSLELLVKEFTQLYQAFSKGMPNPLAPLVIQYSDFALWQRDHLQGEVLQRQLDYWEVQLADIPAEHNLPMDFSRPAQQSNEGGSVTSLFSAVDTQKLISLARKYNVTPFMFLHGAFSLMLGRHSNNNDVVIGTPMANRLQAELDPLIGFFANTMVLRTHSVGCDTVSDYLEHVKKVNLAAQAHQDVPFEQLVEHLQVTRSTNHSPLFQIMLAMNSGTDTRLSLDGVTFSRRESDVVQAKFDIVLRVNIDDNGLHFDWTYDKALFKESSIERYNQHLSNILMAMIEQPQLKLHELPMLSDEEQNQLVHSWNGRQALTPESYIPSQCLHHKFEQRVSEEPNQTALSFDDTSLSFDALNRRSNQLAHHLITMGIKPESSVGVSISSPLEQSVAMLAVMKAGAAYVMLTKTDPAVRALDLILMDSARLPSITAQTAMAHLCLNSPKLRHQLSLQKEDNPIIAGLNDDFLATIVDWSSDAPLYVEHSSIAALSYEADHILLDTQSHVLQLLSNEKLVDPIALWCALLNGSTTDFVSTDGCITYAGIADVAFVTAELLDCNDGRLVELLHHCQKVVLQSDSIDNDLIQQTLQQCPTQELFFHCYPSADNAVSVWHKIGQFNKRGLYPISLRHTMSREYSFTSVYVLDEQLQVTPVGSEGNLYYAGARLADNRQYISSLVDNPFKPHEKLYKTNNLVKWSSGQDAPAGKITFLRKQDDQIKHQGREFNLKLISELLCQINGISDVKLGIQNTAFSARDNGLVVFIVTDASVDIASKSIREGLAEKYRRVLKTSLSSQILPCHYEFVDSLPDELPEQRSTANIFIDSYVAPQTASEVQLCLIWQDLLNLESLSAEDDFFELGGHSLLSVRLVSAIRAEIGVELSIRDVFEYSTIESLAKQIDSCDNQTLRPEVVAKERDNDIPLSFAQQRLWFVDQLQGSSAQYNLPMAIKISGKFRSNCAKTALSRIVARHEILRTVYQATNDGAIQIIRAASPVKLAVTDLRKLPQNDQHKVVRRLAAEDAKQPFDLSNDLMLRAHWIRLSDNEGQQEGVLLFNMHHIAADGWSMNIMFNEFAQQYEAAIAKQSDPLPALMIQYADYSQWQRDYIQGEVLEEQVAYWTEQLADVPLLHDLPLDFERPPEQLFEGNKIDSVLSADVSEKLLQMVKAHSVTPYILVHTIFTILLARHCNSKDIIIGCPVANRLQQEISPLIGFFVNTLALRTQCETEQSFLEYLEEVKQVNLAAQSNQDVPFEQLLECLNVTRAKEHNPLVQIMLAMNTNGQTAVDLEGLTMTALESETHQAKFDLVLDAGLTNDGGHLSWTYDKALFKKETIQTLNSHMLNLIEEIVSNPIIQLGQLVMLSQQEVEHLQFVLNDTEVAYPEHKLVHQMVSECAHTHPDHLAVVFDDQKLTYKELDALTNQLARYLLDQGVGLETLVGISMPRSLEMIVAMVAILKAGAAYVPLDPNYPQSRLKYMIDNSQLEFLLTQSSRCEMFNSMPIKCASMDTLQLDSFSKEALPVTEQTSRNLAYVVYTSGSTGEPKGVQVEHRGVINLVAHTLRNLEMSNESRVAHYFSLSFDVASWECLMTLCNGATLYVCNEAHKNSVELLGDFLEDNQITHVALPPALLPYIDPKRDFALKFLTIGGEASDEKQAWRWAEHYPLFNAYGPTESTVCTHVSQVVPGQTIGIGKPIDNTRAYVLDANQQLLPIGAIGELYLLGDGLSRGYIGNEQRNDEKFVQVTIGDRTERAYKTGDSVKLMDNDELLFIGRTDDQVSLRGFRIELGEIEKHLTDMEEVQSSLALVVNDEAGNKQLVAYVVSTTSLMEKDNKGRLQHSTKLNLSEKLPSYMVPSVIMVVDQWPLTVNGKIDKRALPNPDASLLLEHYVAPENDLECKLVDMWAKLLKIESKGISATANFFDLGGHSLLAVRLVSEIREQLEFELPIKDLFDTPTIRGVSQQIIAGNNSTLRTKIEPQTRQNDEPVITSFAQQRLWFIDELQGGSAEYNMPIALDVRGDFDVDIAEQAISRIIQRHEPLRTVFKAEGEHAYQIVLSDFNFSLQRHNLADHKEDQQQAKIKVLMLADCQKSFDLAEDLMVRASYLNLGLEGRADRGILLFNMHHIASDGWSMSVLLNEFVAQYTSLIQGRPDPIGKLAIQYTDYAVWQRQWLTGDILNKQLGYWKQQLEDVPSVHSMPLDKARKTIKGHKGAIVQGQLDQDISTKLLHLANQHQLTPFMMLHAGMALVLKRHSHSDDIIIGTPVANRMQVELEPLIGFFVNTLVLRTRTDFTEFDEFLSHVRETNLSAQAHQDIPFEQLVESCNVPRSTQHTPLFQIMFSMNTNEQKELSLPNVNFTPILSDNVVAKFDLDLSARITDQGITLSWTYDTDLFTEQHIESLNGDLIRMLSAMALASTKELSALPMLSDETTHYLVKELNQPRASYTQDKLIHQWFEGQVLSRPQSPAVTFAGKSMSYTELNIAANQLAHYLIERGTKHQDLVGIYLSRGFDMIVSVLAILKAGAAYVPLDPAYPQDRLEFMVADSGLKHLLTSSEMADNLSLPETGMMTKVDDIETQSKIATFSIDNPSSVLDHTPSSLAYVIYTSGSTGQPKGVLQTHENIVRLFLSTQDDFNFHADDVWCLFHSIAFDFSVWELWGALFYGGKLVIPDHECTRDTEQFVELCQSQGVSVLNQTPSAFNAFTQVALSNHTSLPALRYVVFGGEALQIERLIPWWQAYGEDTPQLINMYGITETTVHVSFKRLSAADVGTSSIGCRLNDQALYLLDSNKNLVPPGSVGEIYVGGAGVARGYLNQPELTAERFITDPFSCDPDARLYKSGDLARYMENGELTFLGRADDQVKIRGFRIELGEIQNQLVQCETVSACIVLAKEDESGNKRLVAYVQPKNVQNQDDTALKYELNNALKLTLPEYMVPSAFVILNEFPLTANGKVNIKALPLPNCGVKSQFETPVSIEEKALASVWAQVLDLPEKSIGCQDNFFALGGHSLLLIRYRASLNELGYDLPIRSLYKAQNLAEQARMLEQNVSRQAPDALIPENCQMITPDMLPLATLDEGSLSLIEAQIEGGARNIKDIYPLSPLQDGFLFHALMAPKYDPYLIKTVLKCEGEKQFNKLLEALKFVIRRHDSLRTQIVHQGLDEPMQVVCRKVELPLHWIQLDSQPDDVEQWLKSYQMGSSQSLCLEKAPLLRLHVLVNDGVFYAVLFNHHIIEDNLSIRAINSEINAYISNPEINLNTPAQYRDFIWQGQQVDTAQSDRFFKQYLSGFSEPSAPYGMVSKAESLFAMKSYKSLLPASLFEKITVLSSVAKVSIPSILHLAWAIVVGRTSGKQDVTFGTVLSGRMGLMAGIEHMVGLCVNSLPMRVKLDALDVENALQAVQESLNNLIAYEQTPQTRINAFSEIENDSPLFSAVLNCRLQQGKAEQITELNDGESFGITQLSAEEHSNYPVSASLDCFDDKISFTVEAQAPINPETLFSYFENTLFALVHSAEFEPTMKLSQLELLNVKQKSVVANVFNTVSNFDVGQLSVIDLFDQQATLSPNNAAISYDGKDGLLCTLSYKFLDDASNRLAHYLQDHGVNAGDNVAVCLDLSSGPIIAILAILKVGASYQLVDNQNKPERFNGILKIAKIKTLISQNELAVLSDEFTGQTVVLQNIQSELLECETGPIPTQNLAPQSIAYAVSQGDTTGIEKVIQVAHHSLVNLTKHCQQNLSLDSKARVLCCELENEAAASWQILMSLCSGAELYIPCKSHLSSGQQLAEVIYERNISIAFIPAATLATLDSGRQYALQSVVVTGQLIDPQPLWTWASRYPVFHSFGLNEGTICTHLCKLELGKPVTLSQPIANTRAYILDSHLQFTPEGAVGELYVAGEALFAGYVDQPRLNQSLFCEIAINNNRERLYSTGYQAKMSDYGEVTLLRPSSRNRQLIERESLLYDWNHRGNALSGPKGSLAAIHSEFRARASRSMDRIALIEGSTLVSYAELDQNSERLSIYLINLGVTPETIIGLSFSSPLDLCFAMLAVLKAGAAFSILNVSDDAKSQAYQKVQASVAWVLADTTCPDSNEDVNWIHVSQLELTMGQPLTQYNTPVRVSGDHLACIINGAKENSPFEPVEVEQGHILTLLNTRQHSEIHPNEYIVNLIRNTSDIDPILLITGLLAGNCTRFVNVKLMQTLETAKTVVAPVQLAQQISEQLTSQTQQLLLVGENVAFEQTKTLLNTLQNTDYFLVKPPTSKNAFVRWHHIKTANKRGMYPVAMRHKLVRVNDVTSVYVLNDQRELCAIGETGNLFYGGARLCTDKLSPTEVLENPFLVYEKMYDSGQLARWLPAQHATQGTLELLGRANEQAQINGATVNLQNITQALCNLEGVDLAKVFLNIDDEKGNSKTSSLIAYVSLSDKTDTQDLQSSAEHINKQLKAQLPAYMLPGMYVFDDDIPEQLPAAYADNSIAIDNYLAPRTEIERQLCLIWQDLLEIERVGAEDDFFQQGGHSLLSIRLVSAIRSQLGIEISVAKIFEHSTVEKLALEVERSVDAVVRPEIIAQTREQHIPLSFAQQRLWFIDQLQGGSANYNMPMALKIEGSFDLVAAQRALNQIVERHEVLRTVYFSGDEGPAQIIKPAEEVIIEQIDLCHLRETAQSKEVIRLAIEDANKAFNLTQDLMLRATWLLLDDKAAVSQSVLLFNMHHIASDGWSIGILMKEFAQLYQAFQAGRSNPLAPLSLQYADFATWQRNYLQGEVLRSQIDYWAKQLENAPVLHNLPLDYVRPEHPSNKGAIVSCRVSASTTKKLNHLAGQQGITQFMLMHGVFSLLLARQGNNPDVVIGTPVANRLQQELNPLIGLFVNSMVLRTDCSRDETFIDYLQQIKEVNLSAQAHQDIPFEQLLDRLEIPRSTQHNPLFQIMLSMNTPSTSTLTLDGLRMSPIDSGQEHAKFDLLLNITADDNGTHLRWTYDAALFAHSSIEKISQHMMTMLEAIAENSDIQMAQIPMLSKSEKHYLLHAVNDTQCDYPQERLVHELISQHADEQPDQTALVFDQRRLSYRELDKVSNQLAHYLRAQGVGLESFVGIAMNRSIDMIVAMVAVMKAGGVYVPLDPDYPQSRLDYMMENSNIKVLLTQRNLISQFQQESRICVPLDEIDISGYDEALPEKGQQGSHNLAYVIYTSGSTGQPKGVQIEHAGAVNLALHTQKAVTIGPESRVMHFASLSFDAATWEMLMSLCNGAGLYICAEEHRKSTDLLADFMLEHSITHAFVPPALLPHLDPDRDFALQAVLIGGEACDENQAWRWANQYPLYNAYGPAESTVVTHMGRVESGHPITIGKPISNVRAYVLDFSQNLVPKGVSGELYVAGDGLARGYIDKAEMTTQQFIELDIDGVKERLYRTGDKVCMSETGDLAFMSRTDDQISLRGFRIELGEIEQQLVQSGQVNSSLVIAQRDAQDRQQLVAYVLPLNISDTGDLIDSLKTHLSETLPTFMMPSEFVVIERWPLTVNGKIDKKALPKPDLNHLTCAEYVAPKTDFERTLCDIWQATLNLQKVGVSDNFFSVGGDSITVLQIVRKAKDQGVYLDARDIFKYQSIAELGENCANRNVKSEGQLDVPIELLDSQFDKSVYMSDGVEDCYSVTNAQNIMLRAHRDQNLTAVPYHTQMVFDLNVPMLSPKKLQQAWDKLIRKHATLRTRFLSTPADGFVQLVVEPSEFELPTINLTKLSKLQQQEQVERIIAQDISNRYRCGLENSRVRVQLIKLGWKRWSLFISMDHAIVDGWGHAELLKELVMLYAGKGEDISSISNNVFKEHVALEIEAGQSVKYQAAWVEILKDHQPMPELTALADKEINLIQSTKRISVEDSKTLAIGELAKRLQIPSKVVYMLAYQYALSDALTVDNITVDSVTSARSSRLSDPINAFGLFWNLLPVNLSLTNHYSEDLKTLSLRMLKIDSFAQYPIDALVDYYPKKMQTIAAFNYVNFHNLNNGQSAKNTLMEIKLGHTYGRFHHPIMLAVSPQKADNTMACQFDFNPDYFNFINMDRVVDQFIIHLDNIINTHNSLKSL